MFYCQHKIKKETLLEAAVTGDISLNYDELLLSLLAAERVMVRAIGKLVAAAEGKSERIVIFHLFEELKLEKNELVKEFSFNRA